METNYDEDLSDNIFFQVLQTDHFELFQRATIEGWVICVPRLGSLPKYALTHDDFFSHILIPSDELPETHFRSLNDKDIKICNRVVTVESSERAASLSTHILFEETFYTEDMLKYKVFCIENPLQYYSENNENELTITTVDTFRDCIDVLWSGSSGKDILVQIDEAIIVFLSRNNKLEYKNLDVQKDLVKNLYDQCLQITLQNKTLHGKTLHNRHLFESVKVSVESYILHGIYKKLINGITACTASEDSGLNKTIRNLTEIQLKDLDVRLDLYDTIPMARRELTRVEGYSTVLGKVGCLKRTLAAISKQDSNSLQGNVVATDDLLPILIFLVIKSGLANWIAHLTFMKQFCFSYSSNYQVDQHSFLITSLEAAIEHINSGSLLYSAPEAQLDYYNKNLYQNFEIQDVFVESACEEFNSKIPKSITNLFEYVRQGNVEKMIEILNQQENQQENEDVSKYLCHPLCSCDKCEFQISLSMVDTNPTIHSCDDRGLTALHIASIVGQPKVVDLLISLGSNVNAIDQSGATPLHYACSRGHKNELLLLLHSGAKIDKYDNDGNTPLHCAANNGHEGCVKAILYFSEQSCYKFDINKQNNQGETALHNAARWGYKFIIKTLLEYGANPKAENKRKLTPIAYAHNLHVAQILTSAPRHSNLKLIIPQYKTEKHDIQVAASTQTRLDFTDECKSQIPKGRILKVGDRPHTVDQMKKVDRLLIAITHGDIRLSCFYLGLEGSLSLKHNCHPLCECKQKNKDEFGESKSCDVLNVNICNSDGFTPIHIAAMYGHVELIQILLKASAYTNVQTKKGLTPLHLACQNQSLQIVQLLLDTNCDLNIQDCCGNSALHFACNTRNVRLVELLLKYKPNRNLRNSEGRTVLEETEENMCLTLTRLLSEG